MRVVTSAPGKESRVWGEGWEELFMGVCGR